MPASDDAATVIAGALFELASALASGSNRVDSDDAVAPERLWRALNGGTEAHIGSHYADVVMSDSALPRDARILDLGCGYGRVAQALVERLSDEQEYVGLDPQAEVREHDALAAMLIFSGCIPESTPASRPPFVRGGRSNGSPTVRRVPRRFRSRESARPRLWMRSAGVSPASSRGSGAADAEIPVRPLLV